jgi:CRISPR system Cascade subunit CasE
VTLYLSRVRVRRDQELAALAPLLDPGGIPGAALDPLEQGRRIDAHHRLIWSLFADHAGRRRDFLWRSAGGGAFLVLSRRPPSERPALFEPPEVKPFAPALVAGDRLAFALRANATRDRKGGPRVDVVMDALHSLPRSDRNEARMRFAQDAGEAWLGRQGSLAGFEPERVSVSDYSVAALPGNVGRRGTQPRYGILEMTGELVVTDPPLFLERLAGGFGRARAFGCGLMLVRRA